MLNALKGKPCIKVTMGVEFIVTEQKVRECGTCVAPAGAAAHSASYVCWCQHLCGGGVTWPFDHSKLSREKAVSVFFIGVRAGVRRKPSLLGCVSDVVL